VSTEPAAAHSAKAPKSIEQGSSLDAYEAVDAHVPNVSAVARERVVYVAVLLDFLAARARVELVAHFDRLQYPFGSSNIETLCSRKGEDVLLQAVIVVRHGAVRSR
jgi:hypothetical protein